MKAQVINDSIDHITINGIQSSATRLVPAKTILIVVRSGILAHSLPVAIAGRSLSFNQDIRALIVSKQVMPEYVLAILAGNEKKILLCGIKRGGTVHSFQSGYLEKFAIPLPPLSVQEEIVAEIGRYQTVIDGARSVVENWRPSFAIDPEWPVVKLGDVCGLITDGTHETPIYCNEGFVFLSSKNVKNQVIDWDDIKYIPAELHRKYSKRVAPEKGDVLLAKNGTTGIAAIVDRDVEFDIYVSLALLRPSRRITTHYLHAVLNAPQTKSQFSARLHGIGVPNLHLVEIRDVSVPLPPLPIQKEIVSRIEAEREIVNANKKLIELMKKRIEETIARVWE